MAEPKSRLNLSVDPIAHEIVLRTGNASAYITRIALDRRKLWTAAMHHLNKAGWSSREIKVACFVLNDFNLDMETEDLANSIRLRLPDDPSQVLGAVYLNVDIDDWKRCMSTLANPMICWMIWIVEREYWMGNSELIKRVGEFG